MSLWQSFKSWLSVNNSGTANPASWLVEWFRGSESDSGIAMDTKTALSYAPIWYAINKIAGHVGQMPCVLHERKDERRKVKALRHPSYRVMKVRPNKMMTPFMFKETLTAHAILNGNGRAVIEKNNRNDVISLVPLLPDRTVTVLMNDEKWHVTTNPETGDKTKFPDRDVVHIPGLAYDGIVGYSVIDQIKNSVGLGLAGEKQANRHFKNNSTPGLVLEAPPGTFRREEDARKFLSDWNSYHTGLENANKTALLRDGIKATSLSVNARDSQWIEQRKFQRQEAALWMMLEQILGDDSSVSYNSLEQKNLAYLTNCLNKWLVKWEEELNDKLLTDSQKRNEQYFFKFNTGALLKGTTKERYEVYAIGRQIGVLSANDVREREDMEPIENGDNYDNPAIVLPDTKDSPEQSDSPSDAPTQSNAPAATDRERRLVSSRLKELLTLEGHRVTAAAGKEKNFLAWMDQFYSDEAFGGRIASVYSTLGASGATETHITQSKTILLDLCSTCTRDVFVSTVDAATSEWHMRADSLATTVLTYE